VSSHVRVAIADTCTPSFAHLILRNAPVLPRGLDASGLSERVEAIQPLAKLSRGALVLVHVTRTIGGRQGAGTLELTLADVHGRWRVSAFAVLS
jgi:hypothetical protein